MGIDSYNPTVRARLNNASKTRILNLKESAMHRIPEDLKKLNMLRNLDLSVNYLTTIPEYFGGFLQLKVLNLARNQLEEVPVELGGLTNLETLNLSQNKFSKLPEALESCEKLVTLDASECQFLDFPLVICKLKNIQTVTLTSNRLETLPDEVCELKAISLILNKNRILRLNSSNLCKCERLRVLNVDENQLCRDEIEEFLVGCGTDVKVSFENNVSIIHTNDLLEMGNESSKSKSLGDSARKIVGKSGPSTSTVNKHVAMAGKSRILQLKGSGLKKAPEDLEQLNVLLRNLDLSDNKIREIPSFLGSFSQLKQLHLSNNCIEFLPDEIGHLKKLEILNLGGNKLTKLPDTIAGCTDLKNIDCSSNAITEFPTAVFAILQLDFLNLNGNQIENIPDEISELKVLELSINQNRLTILNATNLIKCPRLRTLRVEENCLNKSEFTKELLENSSINLIAYQGNLFQEREFQDLNGYEAYQERFTATKRKM